MERAGGRGPRLLHAGNPLDELTTDASAFLPARTQDGASGWPCPLNHREPAQQTAHKLAVQETSNDVQKKSSRLREFFHLFAP